MPPLPPLQNVFVTIRRKRQITWGGRGSIAQWLAKLIFFLEVNIVNVAEVNQWPCLEESGQWLENVDQTHLILTSGKLVLQKSHQVLFQ